QVIAAANVELAPRSAEACPYIDQYFTKYRQGTATDALALISRFAPGTCYAQTARELIVPLVMRIQDGIRQWKTTGRMPADVEAYAPGATATVNQPTLSSLESELGPGQQLDGATATRMSGAMGADVSAARIHAGPEAARKAAE